MRSALRRAERLSADDLSLPDGLDELDLWLADDRQWEHGKPRHWRGLLADVESGMECVGTSLTRSLDDHAPGSRASLVACRRVFANLNEPPDPALRRRLGRSAEVLREALCQVDAFLAAFVDFRDAANVAAESADRLARVFLAVGEAIGHDAKELRRRLNAMLADEALEMALVRGQPPPGDPYENAGVPANERFRLIEAWLGELPLRRTIVVWLEFAFARVDSPPVARVGENVMLYSGDWLVSALTMDGERPHELPSELRTSDDDNYGLRLLFDAHRGQQRDEEIPYSYLRVRLTDALQRNAVRRGRQVADTLISLASLYSSDPSLWRLSDSYALVIDGATEECAVSAPVVEGATITERVALTHDRTVSTLLELAPRLGPPLPVRDADLDSATRLLDWLRSARTAPEPARLVLCDRVLEQVSGWAGVSSPTRFVDEHLALARAYHQIRAEIINAGWAALDALGGVLPSLRSPNSGIYDTLISDPELAVVREGGRHTISLRGILVRLDVMLAHIPAEDDVAYRLRALRDHTATGKATASWMGDLLKQVHTRAARARRTRNALLHGGPLADATVRAVTPFVGDACP